MALTAMARSLFISLWNLLPMSNRPMQISCRWFLRGHLDVHCRKTVSALRQYNAPASLESSERKIKISKRFCIVGVARKTSRGCSEKIAKALKFHFVANGAGSAGFFSAKMVLLLRAGPSVNQAFKMPDPPTDSSLTDY
jgi:hypothetical protein